MSSCRYDRDAGDYLNDGEPCRHDDYGDPTKHCTARRSCANHIGRDELTCARCIGRVRTDLRRIPTLAALMLPVALDTGVDSEAANMAGPAADPEAWSWRKITAKQGGPWHLSLVEDDDDVHPYLVLGRWDMMIREDYGHPSNVPVTITNAADYLDRQLHRIAQDDGQDFPLLAREIRRCRAHLESVMSDSQAAERGVPCPTCAEDERFVRLVREYGHWCEREDCEQIHYETDEGDVWRCPRDRHHEWSHADYENRLVPRLAANA